MRAKRAQPTAAELSQSAAEAERSPPEGYLNIMLFSPIWSVLLMVGPEGVQHLMLHSCCINTPATQIEWLPATQLSNISPTTVIPRGSLNIIYTTVLNSHVVCLRRPRNPADAAASSATESLCTLDDGIPFRRA